MNQLCKRHNTGIAYGRKVFQKQSNTTCGYAKRGKNFLSPIRARSASAELHATGVVIYSPRTYKDVQLLIDHLKMREQVIVDFSTLNQQAVYRILDFMSGAIYALDGSIQQITKNIFLFAPQGVTITIPPQIRG